MATSPPSATGPPGPVRRGPGLPALAVEHLHRVRHGLGGLAGRTPLHSGAACVGSQGALVVRTRSKEYARVKKRCRRWKLEFRPAPSCHRRALRRSAPGCTVWRHESGLRRTPVPGPWESRRPGRTVGPGGADDARDRRHGACGSGSALCVRQRARCQGALPARGGPGGDQRSSGDARAVPRLFEPPFIEPGVPNPRHLDEADYRELAVTAAVRRASKRCRSSTPPVASSMEVSAGSDAGATDPAAILGSTSVAAADSGA